MPIGQLERAAQSGRGELYPQSLLGRQVYWTALGEFDQGEQALFDEYGDLEPRRGSPQITPLIRIDGALHGAPGCASVQPQARRGLVADRQRRLVRAGRGAADDRLRPLRSGRGRAPPRQPKRRRRGKGRSFSPCARSRSTPTGSTAATRRSARSPSTATGYGSTTGSTPRFRAQPDAAAVADFDDGDVVRLIDAGPRETARSLRSASGLASAACEFAFSLRPGESAVGQSSPRRCATTSRRARTLRSTAARDRVRRAWRKKLGPRRIVVGDREVSDTLEAQTALHSGQRHPLRLQAGPAQLRPHLDPRRLLAGARPAVGRLDRRGQALRPLVRRAHLRRTAWFRRSSTSTARSIAATAATSSSTRRASSSASPPRSTASPRIARFSRPFSSRSSARRSSSRRCAREPTRRTARRPASTASSRRRSATRATASRRTATGTTISP